MQSLTRFSGVSIGDFFNRRVYDCWSDRPKTATEKFVVKKFNIYSGLLKAHITRKNYACFKERAL